MKEGQIKGHGPTSTPLSNCVRRSLAGSEVWHEWRTSQGKFPLQGKNDYMGAGSEVGRSRRNASSFGIERWAGGDV